MATFVLVPGAWLGGWCWAEMAPVLRAAGHNAFTPTLTGLGERAHLATPDVGLGTHVQDVVNALHYEDLRDAILVGHSYAGAVVTGVADRSADRLSKVVYLDAGPVPDGSSFLGIQPPDTQEYHERLVREHGDGWRLEMPSWDELTTVNGASLEGLDDATLARIRARATAQPFGTYTELLRLTSPADTSLPKVLIACSFPLEQVRAMIDGGHPWFAEMARPEWSFVEVTTGHWPMFSAPHELAAALLQLA